MSIHTIKDSILGVPREEDNSTYLIYPQSYPRPHFINHYMLNLWYEADGKTFQKLFEEYQNRYRDVPIEKIQSDIINSIIYLYNLEMVEITGEDMLPISSMSFWRGISPFRYIPIAPTSKYEYGVPSSYLPLSV